MSATQTSHRLKPSINCPWNEGENTNFDIKECTFDFVQDLSEEKTFGSQNYESIVATCISVLFGSLPSSKRRIHINTLLGEGRSGWWDIEHPDEPLSLAVKQLQLCIHNPANQSMTETFRKSGTEQSRTRFYDTMLPYRNNTADNESDEEKQLSQCIEYTQHLVELSGQLPDKDASVLHLTRFLFRFVLRAEHSFAAFEALLSKLDVPGDDRPTKSGKQWTMIKLLTYKTFACKAILSKLLPNVDLHRIIDNYFDQQYMLGMLPASLRFAIAPLAADIAIVQNDQSESHHRLCQKLMPYLPPLDKDLVGVSVSAGIGATKDDLVWMLQGMKEQHTADFDWSLFEFGTSCDTPGTDHDVAKVGGKLTLNMFRFRKLLRHINNEVYVFEVEHGTDILTAEIRIITPSFAESFHQCFLIEAGAARHPGMLDLYGFCPVLINGTTLPNVPLAIASFWEHATETLAMTASRLSPRNVSPIAKAKEIAAILVQIMGTVCYRESCHGELNLGSIRKKIGSANEWLISHRGRCAWMSPATSNAYLPPSGMNGKDHDVWSVGTILYALVIGSPPRSKTIVKKGIVNSFAHSNLSSCRQCTHPLATICAYMMNPSETERWSPIQCLAALTKTKSAFDALGTQEWAQEEKSLLEFLDDINDSTAKKWTSEWEEECALLEQKLKQVRGVDLLALHATQALKKWPPTKSEMVAKEVSLVLNDLQNAFGCSENVEEGQATAMSTFLDQLVASAEPLLGSSHIETLERMKKRLKRSKIAARGENDG
jgi:hypothetical protein